MPAAVVHPPRTFGQKLRWARKAKGLSHDKLGAIARVSRQHLIALEQDKHQPGDDLLARLAAAVDQPLEFFLGPRAERLKAEQRDRLRAALEPLLDTLADDLLEAVRDIAQDVKDVAA